MTSRTLPRLLQTPAVLLLLVWMLVPLGMTLFFSFIRYVLNSLRRPEWTTPSIDNWRGWGNYEYVLYSAKDFWFAVQNSLFIVGSILVITVVFGLAIAVLINRPFQRAAGASNTGRSSGRAMYSNLFHLIFVRSGGGGIG